MTPSPNDCSFEIAQPGSRDVFVGKHSVVWRNLAPHLSGHHSPALAISHCDVAEFAFKPLDRVWVLAYARRAADNTRLIQALAATPAQSLVYVSSSSTIVTQVTGCYAYPRLKRQAERDALALPGARVLTLGMMYADPTELPPGACIATSYSELAAFLAQPEWTEESGRCKRLFRVVRRPYSGRMQPAAQAAYGVLIRACGRRPCLLRPLDLALRVLGARWYGYVYLSNKLWISTTS